MRALLAAPPASAPRLLLPVPLYGLHGTIALHVDWWRTVTQSTAPNLLNADNVSLAAMYAKWIGTRHAPRRSLATVSGCCCWHRGRGVRVRRRRRRPEGLEAALLLTLIPLLSPQGWDYVFLIATPAVVSVVRIIRATEAAFSTAERVTLTGSTMPSAARSP